MHVNNNSNNSSNMIIINKNNNRFFATPQVVFLTDFNHIYSWKNKKRLAKNGVGSDPIGILRTSRKILGPTWKKLLFIKTCKQDFFSPIKKDVPVLHLDCDQNAPEL